MSLWRGPLWAGLFGLIAMSLSTPSLAAKPKLTQVLVTPSPAAAGLPVQIQIQRRGGDCAVLLDNGLGQVQGPIRLKKATTAVPATYENPGRYTIRVWGKKTSKHPKCGGGERSVSLEVKGRTLKEPDPPSAREGIQKKESEPRSLKTKARRSPPLRGSGVEAKPAEKPGGTAPIKKRMKMKPAGSSVLSPKPEGKITKMKNPGGALDKILCFEPTRRPNPPRRQPSDDRLKASTTTPGSGLVRVDQTKTKAKATLGIVGATLNLRATLIHESGKPVMGQDIHFSVAGAHAGVAKTNRQGEASLPFTVPSTLGTGQRPIHASFHGNRACGGSQGDATISLFKSSVAAKLEARGKIGDVPRKGEKVWLTGEFTRISDNEGLQGRAVTVSLDGKPLGTFATDRGKVEVEAEIPEFSPSNTQLVMTFEGDALYAYERATLNFAVADPNVPATLTWTNLTLKYGETAEVTAFLTGGGLGIFNDSPTQGREIQFSARRGENFAEPNGQSIGLGKATTDQLGRAKLFYKADRKFKYPMHFTLTASVRNPQGLDIHRPRDSQSLKIEKSPVKIAVSGPSNAAIGQKISLKARILRATDNAPMAGVTLSGNAGTQSTDASGWATFPVTVSASGGLGARSYKVRFYGDGQHLDGEASHTIQAGPATN